PRRRAGVQCAPVGGRAPRHDTPRVEVIRPAATNDRWIVGRVEEPDRAGGAQEERRVVAAERTCTDIRTRAVTDRRDPWDVRECRPAFRELRPETDDRLVGDRRERARTDPKMREQRIVPGAPASAGARLAGRAGAGRSRRGGGRRPACGPGAAASGSGGGAGGRGGGAGGGGRGGARGGGRGGRGGGGEENQARRDGAGERGG